MIERFWKMESNKALFGPCTVIYDVENTEPVCIVYHMWHPEKVDIILNALKEKCLAHSEDPYLAFIYHPEKTENIEKEEKEE